MMRMVSALVCLTGCAHQEPLREVLVPVPVPCIAKEPIEPELVTDDQLRKMTDYQVPLALWRDRKQRKAYIGELKAAVSGCSRLP